MWIVQTIDCKPYEKAKVDPCPDITTGCEPHENTLVTCPAWSPCGGKESKIEEGKESWSDGVLKQLNIDDKKPATREAGAAEKAAI